MKKIAGKVIKCPKCKSKIKVSIDGTQFRLVRKKDSRTDKQPSENSDQDRAGNTTRAEIVGSDQNRPNSGTGIPNVADLNRFSKETEVVGESKGNEHAIDSQIQSFAPVFNNSIGMIFKLIPSGAILLGDHPVKQEVDLINSFYLGIFQVTQQEYQRVMGHNPSQFRSPRKPVECVSWEEAVRFCEMLSALPSELSKRRIYRLPTEAEWEYACRAGSASKFCFGDDDSFLCDFAWFGDRLGQGTKYVGQKLPNYWGLHDMHGNVAEWCADVFIRQGKLTSHRLKAKEDDQRVYRGGSWFNGAKECRSRTRHSISKNYKDSYIGFRVAKDLPHC